MSIPQNYKQVAGLYDNLKPTLQKYLEHYPKLVSVDLPFEVVIAYLFQRLERAHRRALYGGIIKIHSANAELTDAIISKAFLTRAEFDDLFERIFKKRLSKMAVALREDAEAIRDKSMHGGEVDEPPLRKAVKDILEYYEAFNSEVFAEAGFEPCGDMRGITGASAKLEKDTTKWLLKGLQLPIK
ncbi:MAG: hypothetical protein WC378_13350 [Opitutaceae bacterium]|jgi:hypothetical protein